MDAVFGFVVNNCDILFSSEFGIAFGRGQFASATFSSEFGLIPYGESNYGYAVLPAFDSFGGEVPAGYGVGVAELPAVTSTGSGGFYIPPEPVVGYAEVPRFSSFGLVITSSPGTGSSTLPAVQSIGGEGNYGIGESTLPAVQSYGNEGPATNIANAITSIYLFDGVGVGQDHIVFLDWTGQITDTISGSRSLIASVLTDLEVTGTYSVLGSFLASAIDSLAISDFSTATAGSGTTFAPALDSADRVWVVNIDTAATSQYDDYGFNSFLDDNGDGMCYGLADDGVYELTGNTDAGATIPWQVDFGISNCGIKARKKILNVYVGVTTGGTTYLKVNVDGTDHTYRVERCVRGPYDYRAKIPHDIQGHQWGFTLMSSDDTDLIGVEFVPANLTRRI
jgi:hypothetical protein